MEPFDITCERRAPCEGPGRTQPYGFLSRVRQQERITADWLDLSPGAQWRPAINRSGGIAMFSKLLYAFALLATFALGACNTMTGVGKDVEAGGQKIQEESKEQQRKM